jgi:hypothetical protein
MKSLDGCRSPSCGQSSPGTTCDGETCIMLQLSIVVCRNVFHTATICATADLLFPQIVTGVISVRHNVTHGYSASADDARCRRDHRRSAVCTRQLLRLTKLVGNCVVRIKRLASSKSRHSLSTAEAKRLASSCTAVFLIITFDK